MSIDCYAAFEAKAALKPFSYEPDPLGPFDVEIAVTYCGICHSDIHLIDDDWGISKYPLVPGHEIIGTIRAAGSAVSNLAVGCRVGVGWQCGSCLDCEWCRQGEERGCAQRQATCVGRPGGFAEAIRVDSRFTHPLPGALASADAAPLLCAGITVYTPLRTGVCPAARVGVVGVGGLGHLAIQFARAFGCEVTAFSTTPAKEEPARRLGAHRFVVSTDPGQMELAADSLDFLLSTVTVPLDWKAWLNILRPQGTLCLVGASPGTLDIPPMALITGQKCVRGSAIGNRTAIREMLQFAGRHHIRAQAELMPMSAVNAAIEKVRKNQARYRIVLES